MDTLAHLFSPRASNHHKAKILHPSSLLIVAFILGVFQIALRAIPSSNQSVLGYAAQISTTDVIRFTNEKRAAAGLPPVTFNQTLTDAAKEKAQYMIDHDFWAHVAPDGTEPWLFFQKHGYKYRYAGENLARDFSNASSAVDAWMASPTHRDNMLSSKYKDIGVAVVEGDLSGSDTTIVVQLFGTLLSEAPSVPVAKAQTNTTEAPKKEPSTTIIPSATGTLTPTPTEEPVVELVAQTEPQQLISGEAPIAADSQTSVFFSQFQTTKGISLAVLSLLFVVTAIDGVIIAKKNIKRRGGRTFAHLAFFCIIIVVVIIIRAGKIM